MKRQTRRSFLEALENRALLAGNVLALVDDGDLVVRGDFAANGVAIHQTDVGRYVVTGFNLNGDTTINGASSPQVLTGVTGDIVVDLRGGDDALVMSNNATTRQALANEVSGGDAGTLAASPEPLTGNVSTSQVGIPNNLLIQTGDGNDGVGLSVRAASTTGGSARIDTGLGLDVVSMKNSFLAQDLTLDTGAGGDVVRLNNVRVEDAIFASLGSGFDRLTATGVRAGGMAAYGGIGNDQISLSNVRTVEDLVVFGGDGNDAIRMAGSVAGGLTVNSGEGSDQIQISDSTVLGAATISAGNGNDLVFLDNLSVDEDLVVLLGAGDDTLKLRDTDADTAFFSGGDGHDVLDLRDFDDDDDDGHCDSDDNTNSFGSKSVTGFESILRSVQDDEDGDDQDDEDEHDDDDEHEEHDD